MSIIYTDGYRSGSNQRGVKFTPESTSSCISTRNALADYHRSVLWFRYTPFSLGKAGRRCGFTFFVWFSLDVLIVSIPFPLSLYFDTLLYLDLFDGSFTSVLYLFLCVSMSRASSGSWGPVSRRSEEGPVGGDADLPKIPTSSISCTVIADFRMFILSSHHAIQTSIPVIGLCK